MPELDDEPPRPSTWQLLFGANKKHEPAGKSNNQEDRSPAPLRKTIARPDHSPQAVSPHDVSSKLLQALKTREQAASPTEEDVIGRQCSDELLGKKNAFAPQLRGQADATTPVPVELAREAKRQARELINTRLKIDQQAEAIRQGKTREQQRREDMRVRPATTRPRGPDAGMAERLKKLREIQKRRDDVEKVHDEELARQKQVNAARETARTQRLTRAPRAAPRSTKTTATTTRVPREDAVRNHNTRESNQEDAREKPKRVAAPIKATKAPAAIAPSGRDLRALDDKIRQLRDENQQVVALEEKLRAQQHSLQIKQRVWTIWQTRVARRKLQEASVARAYEWRVLQSVWGVWRAFARGARADRIAQHTRDQLLLEKQQIQAADRFHHSRHLLLWFQRWCATARALRDARRLETEMRKRREQAARLVERLTRAQNDPSDAAGESSPAVEHPQPSGQVRARTAAREPARGPKLRAKAAWVDESESKTGASPSRETTDVPTRPTAEAKIKSAPSPDTFYVAMLERAEQRKAQREQLKLKYEKQEQEKREALAKQVAEREALLERQKQEERERLREKKREEARVAREKAAHREVAVIKQQSAALHNRLRLLYHHAWRPWQQAWLTSRRVARNARAWHELRVYHKSWVAWQSFVRVCRAQRRLLEQERMARAADHHRRSLFSSMLAKWKCAQRKTQQKQLAVQRLVQWNDTRRAWRRWHATYAIAVGSAQQRETHARLQLERKRAHVVLLAWRDAAKEVKRERVRLAEKELLWKKARMWLND